MKLAAPSDLALGAVPWRIGGQATFLTVVGKATWSLVPGGSAEPTSPLPLQQDVHYGGNPRASLYVASDAALYKSRAEVVLVGSCHAPAGGSVREQAVQLTLSRSSAEIVRKRILVIGNRQRDPVSGTLPLAYSQIPLRYELAYGGADSADNPVGVGAAPGDSRSPNLLDPACFTRVACFGPIAPSWAPRRALVDEETLRALNDAVPTFARRPDAPFFQCAPEDQQVAQLDGGEIVTLTGVHPSLPELSWELPRRALDCHVRFPSGARRLTDLRCDTVWIDVDFMRVAVTWRQVLAVPAEDVDALDAAELTARWTTANRIPAGGRDESLTEHLDTSSRSNAHETIVLSADNLDDFVVAEDGDEADQTGEVRIADLRRPETPFSLPQPGAAAGAAQPASAVPWHDPALLAPAMSAKEGDETLVPFGPALLPLVAPPLTACEPLPRASEQRAPVAASVRPVSESPWASAPARVEAPAQAPPVVSPRLGAADLSSAAAGVAAVALPARVEAPITRPRSVSGNTLPSSAGRRRLVCCVGAPRNTSRIRRRAA